ncbi:IS66 family transposase [Methylorubrum rhodesianum]|uniref:IS66 family transposase n=1 Tax=Methylorubrum rhodesianum TaxID=29427 RepID=UPI003D025CE8
MGGAELPQLRGRSELAKASRYMLARWPALTRAFDDGRIALDNTPSSHGLSPRGRAHFG